MSIAIQIGADDHALVLRIFDIVQFGPLQRALNPRYAIQREYTTGYALLEVMTRRVNTAE